MTLALAPQESPGVVPLERPVRGPLWLPDSPVHKFCKFWEKGTPAGQNPNFGGSALAIWGLHRINRRWFSEFFMPLGGFFQFRAPCTKI